MRPNTRMLAIAGFGTSSSYTPMFSQAVSRSDLRCPRSFASEVQEALQTSFMRTIYESLAVLFGLARDSRTGRTPKRL